MRARTVVPGVVLGLLLVVVVVGPLVAPYDPALSVGPAYDPPGPSHLLGTDQIGRDVASRVLHGGWPVLSISVVGSLVGSLLGVVAGLGAALLTRRGPGAEGLVLRPLDALAALPPLVLALLVLTALPDRRGVALSVVVVTVPPAARVARAAAMPVIVRGHVEAAVLRGEGVTWLLGRELAPLVAGPVLADAGMRLVAAVYLVTAAGFLGFTTGQTDWGLLIVEALPGAEIAPIALAAPVVLVALLATTMNLLCDDVAARHRAVLT